MVATLYEIRDFFIKFDCPWIGMLSRSVYRSEIMDDISTSDDEYSLIAKYRKRITKGIQFSRRSKIIKTHSDNRNIHLRKNMHERRPYSVIKPTTCIKRYFWMIEERKNFFCNFSTSWGIILYLVQFRRKAIHIINHFWILIRRYESLSLGNPVSREHKNCTRFF